MTITVTRQEIVTLVNLAVEAPLKVRDALALRPLFDKMVGIANGSQDLHTPGDPVPSPIEGTCVEVDPAPTGA